MVHSLRTAYPEHDFNVHETGGGSDEAKLVGGTRESINKYLGVYARQGLIRCRRGMVTVLKPEELRKRIY